MTRLLKSSFLWQFAGGFLIGATGFLALQAPAAPVAAAAPVADTAR